MQPKLAHKDESAWDLGDFAYDLDDTLDIGIRKAADYGLKPGVNGYAAFITAFSRRVRSKEVSPIKLQRNNSEAAAGSAVVLTPDFSRTSS